MGRPIVHRAGLSILGVLAIVMAACGSPPAGSASAAPAAGSADPFQAQWTALIDAAKKEGALTIIGGPEGSQQDGAWYAAFEKQFGIKVTLGGGNAAEVATRTLAERTQGVYTIDISSQGGTGTTRFLTAKIFDPLTPQIVNPEAIDRSKGWYVDKPLWVETDQQFCQYVALEAGTNIMNIYYTSTKVSQAEIDSVKSWNDLLDPKWKSRIVIGDIASGEASQDRADAWLLLGQKWFDGILRQQTPTIVAYGDERTYADGVARGDYQVALFQPGTASLDKAIEQKLPVVNLDRTMAEGSPHSGAQRLCLVNKAPHPNAAKLFINWALMKDGQAALNQFTGRDGRLSLRSDVPQGKIKDAYWQRAQKKPLLVVDRATKEYTAAFNDSEKYVKALFVELKIVPGAKK